MGSVACPLLSRGMCADDSGDSRKFLLSAAGGFGGAECVMLDERSLCGSAGLPSVPNSVGGTYVVWMSELLESCTSVIFHSAVRTT